MSSPSSPTAPASATPAPAAPAPTPAPAAPPAKAAAPAAPPAPAGVDPASIPAPTLSAADEAKIERLARAAAAGQGRELSEAELDAQAEAAMKSGGVSLADIAPDKIRSGRHRDAGGGMKEGLISRVTPDEVFVDLGGKAEGMLPKIEFDDPEECKVGKKVHVFVTGVDKGGALKLSKRLADAEGAWRSLQPGTVLDGHVVGMNKGGLELKCGVFRAFMPAGQTDIRRIPDISVFLNQDMKVEVVKLDPETRELVVSRRAILEKEAQEARRRLLNELDADQVRTGTVRSVTDFGAFVDLGGCDGLLHVSDISYARVRHAGDFVKPGDVLEVKVLKVDKSVPDKPKISLGLKQKKTDPWIGIEARYPINSKLKGRVVRLAPFGAFVEVEEGVDGLVHVSEMSWIKRVNHPSDLVKEGQIVEVAVLKIDQEKREIRLGMKQVEANPWETVPTKYPPQSIQKGKVVRTTEFGAFVQLEEGIEGLVHISELADVRVKRVTDVAKEGAEVNVKVLNVDLANQRIGLSIKQAVTPPPPKVLTPEEQAAAAKKAEEEAKARAAEEAARAKKREKLRGGLGGGLGGLKLNIGGK
jgi:small subunit ribosomal protein S1